MVWSTLYDVETHDKGFAHGAPPKQFVAANAHSYLDHVCQLDIRSAPALTRLTGIVCTIGPSTRDPAILERMMETGMNIARINCALDTQAQHANSIQNIRMAAESYSRKLGVTFPMCIALDTKGPEVRTGCLEGGPGAKIELKKGDQIKLTTDKAYAERGNAFVLYIDYENLPKLMQIGNKLFINDGLICLVCTSIQSYILTCTIQVGGILQSFQSVNLPGVEVDLPVVSEKDKEDLIFGLEQGIDMVFASFIRDGAAISEIRDILGPEGKKIIVVAKIENQQGVDNIDEIINSSDGIMVGRGDLGSELPVEKLFLAQKSIIAKCNRAGKPVICANQLLESMTKKIRPSRAECTDVANAVLDGTDCVMLTWETYRGDFPVETIHKMAKICKEAEAAVWSRQQFIELVNKVQPPLEPSHAVAIASVETATKCQASAIIILTTSGKSAYLTSKYRPNCPIISVTRNELCARQMNLYRGVLPLLYTAENLENWTKDKEARFSFGISFGKWKGIIKEGDPVIAVCGSRKGSGYTDTLRILYVRKPEVPTEPCDYVCFDNK